MGGPPGRPCTSSGGRQASHRTPDDTRSSTMWGSACLVTIDWHEGQVNEYVPLSPSETRTQTSAVVISTSPHSPHVARMIAIGSSPPVPVGTYEIGGDHTALKEAIDSVLSRLLPCSSEYRLSASHRSDSRTEERELTVARTRSRRSRSRCVSVRPDSKAMCWSP